MTTDLESGYQDGWNTPGWTAQWPNLPDATPGSPSWEEMGLPDGMTGMVITGKWYDQYGPAWGNLLFTPSVPVVTVNGVEVEFIPYRVYLRNGQLPPGLSVPVPGPSSIVTPDSWTWAVTGRVANRNVSYTIPIPNFGPFSLTDPLVVIDGGGADTTVFTTVFDGGTA